jgi:tol-pal system protein YbgF
MPYGTRMPPSHGSAGAPATPKPDMLSPMIRNACLFLAALACGLAAHAASAQSPTDLMVRIDRLEQSIRELTGSIEQLQYRNQQLEQQVRRMQEDMGSRIQDTGPVPSGPTRPVVRPGLPPPGSLPGPVMSAPPMSPPPALGRRSDVFDPTLNPNAPGAPRPLGTVPPGAEPPPPIEQPPVAEAPVGAPGGRGPGAPLDLSTLSARPEPGLPPGDLPPPPPRNPNATGALQATLPPGNSPKDEYDLGYGYILRKDYALAEQTFQSFLRKYPSDRLAPEAQYWLGESMFQRQRYRDAAEAFLNVSTKYDTTAKAPDALFRLGQSLAALGEKEAACASLGEVLRKYPRASLSVKQGVDREQKRVRC